jgi:hypothetical protein
MTEKRQPSASGSNEAWTAQRFFDLIRKLGKLRIISISGPSTFEAIGELGPCGLAGGFMNSITDTHHWHLQLSRFGHLRSCDETHARSGRRVLFFELREHADAPPFLRIYVHREKCEEFDPQREGLFAAAHGELEKGAVLAAPRAEVET